MKINGVYAVSSLTVSHLQYFENISVTIKIYI